MPHHVYYPTLKAIVSLAVKCIFYVLYVVYLGSYSTGKGIGLWNIHLGNWAGIGLLLRSSLRRQTLLFCTDTNARYLLSVCSASQVTRFFGSHITHSASSFSVSLKIALPVKFFSIESSFFSILRVGRCLSLEASFLNDSPWRKL